MKLLNVPESMLKRNLKNVQLKDAKQNYQR